MPSIQTPIPVVYIAGARRSGSTLLERLISERGGFFAVGELYYLWDRGCAKNELCSCGQPFLNCPFWTDVLADGVSSHEWDIPKIENELRYLLRMRLIPAYRFHVLRTKEFTRRLNAMTRVYGDLYEHIQERSGAGAIVDSSKFAVFGYFLSANPHLDVRVVHLVRDSRAVAHSWQRKKERPEANGAGQFMPTLGPRTTSKMWVLDNFLCGGLRRHSRAAAFLRYEDLVQDTTMAVSKALDSLGLQFDDKPLRDPNRHSVSGNPSRLSDSSPDVKYDKGWLKDMNRPSRRTVTALTALGLIRYGYSLRQQGCG